MKLTNFGRAEHGIVSKAMIVALKAVSDEFGVDLSIEGGKVGSRAGQISIGVTLRDDHGAEKAREEKFKAIARAYTSLGVQPDWFGKTFFFKRDVYVIDGINPNAPKYPIQATRKVDGKSYRFQIATITAQVGETV